MESGEQAEIAFDVLADALQRKMDSLDKAS
jgi:hypothetical protein